MKQPEVNGNKVFSQCSVDRMLQSLSRATCLTAVPTGDISVSPPVMPPTIHYGERIWFEYVVNNLGTESALNSRLELSTTNTIDLYGNGSSDRLCENAGPQPNHSCDLSNLYAGESVIVQYAMDAKELGQIQLDATVSASNDTNLNNNSVRSVIEVLKATDMRTDGNVRVSGGSYIKAGDSIEYSATAWNRGDFDTLSSLTVSTSSNHSLSTIDACSSISHFTLSCDPNLPNRQPLLRRGRWEKFRQSSETTALILLRVFRPLLELSHRESRSTMWSLRTAPVSNATTSAWTVKLAA